jgi:hypothetical protein
VSQLWTNENITKPFNFITLPLSLITRDNEVSSNSTETNPLGSYYIERRKEGNARASAMQRILATTVMDDP